MSHASAARLHGFDKYRENDAVELISRWNMKPPAGITLHRSRTMSTTQICELMGMTVTTVARTIFDLHASDAKEGARVMDEALRRRMVQLGELDVVANLNRGKGQSTTVELERLIDDRRTYGRTDSDLETDVVAFLAANGVPAHVRQFHIAIPNRVTVQVDFAWPERRVCLQAHGKGHQEGKVWDKDQGNENAIRGAGWDLVIATRKILNQTPGELLADLRSAFARSKK